MHSLKTLSNCCNWNKSTFNKMRLFANRVSPVFFQSPSCRIYFAEKNGWSFRISNAEPFYPISKEKKPNKSERYTDKLWDSCASIIWWLPNCRATWLHEIMGWICTYSLHSTWTVKHKSLLKSFLDSLLRLHYKLPLFRVYAEWNIFISKTFRCCINHILYIYIACR